jgi:hypothetical protein
MIMWKISSASLFYSMNAALFLIGIHLWLTYSILRIVILYLIFNIILFALTYNDDKFDVPTRRVMPAQVFQFFAVVLVVLLAWVTVGTYQSLYARPLFLVAVMAITIVFFMAVLLVSCGQSPFTESFALLVAIFIVLLAGFGIFLAQPNLTNSPYPTVDAYRDYTNAIRILSLSRVDPESMILTPYFRSFPVVPLEIASMSLLTGLPVIFSHLILATVADGLAVTSLFLLSKRVAGNYARSCSCLLLLPVLLVFLQPLPMDPSELVEPLRMSIPLVTLILYTAYTRVVSSHVPSGSAFVVLILLFMVVVPMHFATATIAILILGMMAFVAGPGRARTSLSQLGLLGLIFSLLYTFYSAIVPFPSMFQAILSIQNMLHDSLTRGTALIPQLASSTLPSGSSLSETDSFLLSASRAFMVSVFTIFVVKILKARRKVVADVRQRSFYIMLGVLLFIGFSVGLQASLWRIDTRYFVIPLTPAAVIAATMVIVWALRDMATRRKLLLVGLLSLCILSMVTSHTYLETSPAYVRLMPIESEAVTATFVAVHFDVRASDTNQIVTDWPYYNQVQAMLDARYIGIEHTVFIPSLMFEPISYCDFSIPRGTEMLSRRYFAGNVRLQAIAPYVGPLTNNSTWSHFNRIYDDYSVSVYIGRLSC